MQKVQVTLVLVDDVADHVLASPAHQVVILTALTQVYFGTKYLRVSAGSVALSCRVKLG